MTTDDLAARELRTQVASAVVILRHYGVGEPVADMLELAVATYDEATALKEAKP
ncbi:MAG: hypothetical protein HC888_01545 [Candidatus Competibacteraceae bacterium]|nr:hypothetical protein [Candidatus Competibacteraceae bacterium]